MELPIFFAPKWTTLLSSPGFEQYFFSLWSVQATIAALVYPIVIGFVSLLLQRRHSAKASLQIYLHDSAATLTGLSAVFLLMAMGVQYLLVVKTGVHTLTSWLVLDCIWFLLNVSGVIWFLAHTVAFLRPEQRTEIIRAYAINYIWPAEIRKNLKFQIFKNATGFGLLPGPGNNDFRPNSQAAILINSYQRNAGNMQVTKPRKDGWFVADVWFRPLSWAIRSWQRREEEIMASQDNQQSRLCILPSYPGEEFHATHGLCRIEGGLGLKKWEKWLIYMSFVFSKKKKIIYLSINDVFDEYISEVQIAMEAGQESTFSDALADLANMHVAVVRAGEFVSSTGCLDNYSNLDDHNHVFGHPIHMMWVRKYFSLIDMSISRLLLNDSYFVQLIYVPGSLFNRLPTVRPIGIRSNMLSLSRYSHNSLNRWWCRTVEDQGFVYHNPCEAVSLRAPAATTYDNVIGKFVGAWELMNNNYFPMILEHIDSWEKYGEITQFYCSHLDDTIVMLFDSTILGNREGAQWMCDSLMKWCDPIQLRYNNIWVPILDKSKLTIRILEQPWDEAEKVIDLSMTGVDKTHTQIALWKTCVQNYWIDLCCISIYALLQFGKECQCERSLLAQLVMAMVKGKPIRPGGNEGAGKFPIQSVDGLLIIAIIRQYYIGGGYSQGYRARLETVVNRVFELEGPEMVPGRTYTGWHSADLEALRDGQLVLLCLLIKEGWSLPKGLIESIQLWGIENYESLIEFANQLEDWKDRLENSEFEKYSGIYSCIAVEYCSVKELKDARKLLSSLIAELIESISLYRESQLQNSEISEERLHEVSIWASRLGFTKATGEIPVSLFQNVVHVSEQLDEYSLKILKVDKGKYTSPPMATRAINEEEWIENTVCRHVALSVMRNVLKFLSPDVFDAEDPATYWEKVKYGASIIRNNGQKPMLLIASRAEPKWILDWQRSSYDERVEIPKDLKCIRESQYTSEAYVCSLNNIAVFVAPIGAGSSYLMPQETLGTLSFSKIDSEIFVRASIEHIQESESLVNLKLAWKFELDLLRAQSWNLRYVQSESN